MRVTAETSPSRPSKLKDEKKAAAGRAGAAARKAKSERLERELMEQLHTAQAEWSQKRTERLDWITDELSRQNHAVQTFHNVEAAMREYARLTGETLDPLGPEPQLSDFYTPSSAQKDREISFVVGGMVVTGLGTYYIAKRQ